MMNQPQSQFGGSFSQPQQQQKGWLGRNWKLLLPVGCLGLILTVVAFIVSIFFFVMSAMKSSEVYQFALEKAKANPTVVEELGEPIKDGWFVQGSVETSGGDGHAKFQIPISGPKKSGTIYAVASKDPAYRNNAWHFTTLDVEIEGRPGRISLTEKSSLTPATDSGEVSYETEEIEPPPPPAPLPSGSGTADSRTITGGALDDKAVSKPQPPYPPIAKAARASGKVVVQIEVDESGNVISARAVSGHPLLQSAAAQAARQARFSPSKLNGEAVKVTGTLTYNFVLE